MSNDTDTIYFRAAGKSLATIHDFMDERLVAHAKKRDLAMSFGATQWTERDGMMTGLILAVGQDPGKGWRVVEETVRTDDGTELHRVAYPDRRYGIGKDAEAAMRAARAPTAYDLGARLLGGSGMFVHGRRLRSCSVSQYGDTFVIGVPTWDADGDGARKRVPPDAVRLSMSEYWLLREQHESAA